VRSSVDLRDQHDFATTRRISEQWIIYCDSRLNFLGISNSFHVIYVMKGLLEHPTVDTYSQIPFLNTLLPFLVPVLYLTISLFHLFRASYYPSRLLLPNHQMSLRFLAS
jgi:hypothetical protein